MTKSWTATVQEDPDNPDEMLLVFPPEMLETVGWEIGDTLEWIDESDNSGPRFVLKKVENGN